ncbi:hypothetical protein MMC07_004415 [Pseudocyphellaria aurata]|nr:hypothetical protein [Pseudocyphellaria aurata]
MLECLGEDPEREGLRGTPERYAKAMLFFTKGYEENVGDLVNIAPFSEDYDEISGLGKLKEPLMSHGWTLQKFIWGTLDVLQKVANPGAAHKASGARHQRDLEVVWRCSCDGIKPSVHGHARRTETQSNDDHKLHARMHAFERQG